MTIDTASYPDWHGCPYVRGRGNGAGCRAFGRTAYGAGWGYSDGYGSGRGAYVEQEELSDAGDVHEWATGDGTGQGE